MASLINDAKYEAWRKNLPKLYDIFVRDKLASPSLTVQWLPSLEKRRRGRAPKRIGKLRLKQRLVLGSSNANEDNSLMIATVIFSEKRLKTHIDRMQSKPNPATCFIKIETKIKHSGVVNRARYMPQNPAVLATKSSNGDVYIYDVRQIFSASKDNNMCKPELILKGLTAGGSGISWNPNRKGYIVSCSINERTIRVWDTNSKSTKDNVHCSLNKFDRGHPSGVNDCAWHSLHSSLFGSVGNDRNIHIWDIRADFTKMPAITGKGHKSSVNCLSFNYFSDHLLATGSSDQTVAIWDLRKMRSPCHQLHWHKVETCQVHWSPNNESILASSGVDDRVLLWDISEIGAHQTPDEAEEAPPELIFIHGGHSDNILDFSWNITEPWLLSSVSQDKVIQVWQMGDHIYDNNTPKKLSRLKPSKPEESSKCLAVPGSSKSSFSKTSTYLDSQSLESSTFSGTIKSANLIEALKSPGTPSSPRSTCLPIFPPPKNQQSIMATCKSKEALEYLAIPGPSKALDLTPEFLISSESESPLNPTSPLINESEILPKSSLSSPMAKSSFENFLQSVSSLELPKSPTFMELPKSSISCLSPMSKSSLDSAQSVASPKLPKLPTSMESPKSLECPTTPESIKSLEFSSSESPTPPESAKSILLSQTIKSEECQESTKGPEVTDNQNKQELEELTYSDLFKFPTLCHLPDCRACQPIPFEFHAYQKYLRDNPTAQNFLTSDLPSIPYWSTCPGYNYSSECEICFYLKKFSEDEQSLCEDDQSPMSFSPSDRFSPEVSATVDYPEFPETQNPAGSPQSVNIKNPNDPSIHVDDPVFPDFRMHEDFVATQDFETLPDVTQTSDIQEPQANPLHLEGAASQYFQISPYNKKMQDITDYLEELSDFQTPPGKPASQHIKETQDVPDYTQDTPNIQESPDPVSINILNTPNIPSFPDFHNLTESPPYTNILCSHDKPQNQDIPTPKDVPVLLEVPTYPGLKEPPDGPVFAGSLDPPDGPSIKDIPGPPGKPT